MNTENEAINPGLEEILQIIYNALLEKGYDPARQLAGYLLSEDPVYIPNHNNARGLIRSIDRDELINAIVEYYFSSKFPKQDEKI